MFFSLKVGLPLLFYCDVCVCTVETPILSLIVMLSLETFTACLVLLQIFEEYIFTPQEKLCEETGNV